MTKLEALRALAEKVEAGDVSELLRYDPKSGKLFWKEREAKLFQTELHAKSWNSRYAGREAFTTVVKGYKAGSIANKHVYAHRAAFACMNGRWPKFIDHINGDKSDNSWENLREVTHMQNMRNIPITSANTSGVIGVTFLPKSKKWLASIGINGKSVFLGEYDAKEMAIVARAAAEKVAGFHENHGRALIAQEEGK